MITKTTTYTLVDGDSGSPTFAVWTNANGVKELSIIGNNAAVDTANGNNLQNFLGRFEVMNALNTTTTQDGFSLRVVGNVSATWQGGKGNSSQQTQLGLGQNWSGNSVPSDLYVRFQGSQTTFRNIDVNAATTLRGLYFTSTGSATNSFTFSGNSTLTIGRGGIVNYDVARQTFTANLTLGDHQYWDGGAGGITISNINSNGKLLEITGAGTNRITGNMSGAGGLAVSGGRLEVTASNSYTGATWVHGGRLVVNGRIDSSSGVRVGAYGSLGGSGRVAAISGSGSIDPGNSPGILTAPSVDPTGGLDFNFEFTGLSPVYSDAFNSVNDLLRLTSATPFTASLSTFNTVNVYFSFTSLNPGSTYTGGFFTDQINDFLASIDQSIFRYYVLAAGTGQVTYNEVGYDLYTGYDIEVRTVLQTANFADGTVNGRVTQFQVVPEPSTYALLILGAGVVAVVLWRRRRAVVPVKD
jgi:autotransporter-associated beta strand protein